MKLKKESSQSVISQSGKLQANIKFIVYASLGV